MVIRVRLYGTFRDLIPGYKPADGISLEVDGPMVLATVLEHYRIDPAATMIIINGKVNTEGIQRTLTSEDTVQIFPLLGGG